MDIKRREFLKLAGLSALAGVGAPTAFHTLLQGDVQASEPTPHGAEAAAAPTGKRYGMLIDVKKFKFMKDLAQKCIDACHSIHNVPKIDNKKEEVKWLWTETYEHAFPDASQYKRSTELEDLPFLTLCNHCDNPPCVRACPTKATFKSKDGIINMDYHRCIGCRFCMAACPFGARSFNWRDPRPNIANVNMEYPTRMRGVVEKCTFCVERIMQGLEPACVEAAKPVKGIIFGDLNDANTEISRMLKVRFTIQRKPSLGTMPSVFYMI